MTQAIATEEFFALTNVFVENDGVARACTSETSLASPTTAFGMA